MPRTTCSTDDAVGVQVAGGDIALYKVEGRVFATDNICTMAARACCEGFLEGYEIECPPCTEGPLRHSRWPRDLRTGHRTNLRRLSVAHRRRTYLQLQVAE